MSHFVNGYDKNDKEKPKTSPDTSRPIPPPSQQKSVTKGMRGSVSRRQPKGFMKWIIAAVCAMGCVIAAILIIVNSGVKVVDFNNWKINDLRMWASENKIQLKVDEQFNDQVEEGLVYQQGKAKGEKMKKGEVLSVTVSKGHDLSVEVDIPDFKSMSKAEIEKWSEDNFMTKVRIVAEASETVPMDKVIKVDINDNTVVDKVKRSSPIYITISKGVDTTTTMIEIPDMKTMAVADIQSFGTEKGIVIELKEQYDEYVAKGSVISQSVKATESLEKGKTLTVVVSKGKKILMPNFSKYSKDQASAVAQKLGITVNVVERYSSRSKDKLISQNMKAGKEVTEEDFIELKYSLGNKVALSSYVGQNVEGIQSWAKPLNDQGAKIRFSISYTKGDSAPGTILHQYPKSTDVSVYSKIKLVVSSGNVVFAPDFVAPLGSTYAHAITREKAQAMCKEKNIVPIFIKEKNAKRLPGEIWYQSISAGSEMNEGAKITLKYNPGKTLQVPNYMGMKKDDATKHNLTIFLDIEFKLSDDYVPGKEGVIIAQSVAANTTVQAGKALVCTVGRAADDNAPSNSTSEDTSLSTP